MPGVEVAGRPTVDEFPKRDRQQPEVRQTREVRVGATLRAEID